MISQHLFKCLSQDTALTALCAKRIFPNIAQEAIDKPHIVYQQISAPVDYYSTGQARDRHRISIDLRCFGCQGYQSPFYKQAHTVARAARAALERVSGQTHSEGGVLLSAEINNQIDLYDDQAKWHYVVLSISLYYCEET